MARRLNIFIAGGYDEANSGKLQKSPSDFAAFGRALGREVMRQGHLLLNGGMTDFDRDVAQGAVEQLESERVAPEEITQRVRCYVPEGRAPIHNYGCVMESDLDNWDIGGRHLVAPEVVRFADLIMLVGGFGGTFKAANWARVESKPILAFATFGGAAEAIHEDESSRFSSGNSTQFDYDSVAKRITTDWADLAASAVEFSEKTTTSKNVFVIMSFAEEAEFDNAHKCFKSICEEYEYEAQRVDESNTINRIVPEIMNGIRECAFVIADISNASPNVYYEVGFAEGAGKPIVFTAKAGTKLPFDVRDAPVIFYDSYPALKEKLRGSVGEISRLQGRSK